MENMEITQNFRDLNLNQYILKALDKLKFETPTPIQAQVIPLANAGRDILASAQTGTGKTGAFGIPAITYLLANPNAMALILVPTRELAMQVAKVLYDLLDEKRSFVRLALLIGGENIVRQFKQLKGRPRLIIGTPGRIIDHISRNSLQLDKASMLILDEADRMLDMGFMPQIDEIIAHLSPERQNLLFSATLSKKVMAIAERYLNNPERIFIAQPKVSHENLKHEVIYVTEQEKEMKLLEQLTQRKGSIIVFVKTKINADKLAYSLRKNQHNAEAIHGDLSHRKRAEIINGFRNANLDNSNILVATDIAARGLDISHVAHVINFDLPQAAEEYVHRIGRTARAGREGEAICFVTPSDRGKWRAISQIISYKDGRDAEPDFMSNREKSPRYGSGNRGKSYGSSGDSGAYQGGYNNQGYKGGKQLRRRDEGASGYSYANAAFSPQAPTAFASHSGGRSDVSKQQHARDHDFSSEKKKHRHGQFENHHSEGSNRTTSYGGDKKRYGSSNKGDRRSGNKDYNPYE